MGSSPSKGTADNATPNLWRASSGNPAQQTDSSNTDTFKRGLVSQPLPMAAISAKQLAMAKTREKNAALKKVLDEFPELADSVSFVKRFMTQLDENVEADVKANTMTLSSKKNLEELLDFSFDHEPMVEHKKILGDEIAAGKGGRIFTDYMRALSPRNSENANKAHLHYRKECLNLLKSVCWNYSDASSEFCFALGRAGCFRLLVDDIKSNIGNVENKDVRHEIILPSVSILHNCAKFSDNKIYLNEANALEALVPLLKVDAPEIKMIATLTVAYIIEEKDNAIISTDNNMVKLILRYLQGAIASQDHKFDGFRAEEIVSGLLHLASNDKNKEAIVNEGVLPMLTELMKKGDDSEKSIATKTIWVLSFSKSNQKKICESDGLMDSLKKLSASEGPWRISASGAIWVLEEDKRLDKVRFNKVDEGNKFQPKRQIQSLPPMLPSRHQTSNRKKKAGKRILHGGTNILMASSMVQRKIEVLPEEEEEEDDTDDEMIIEDEQSRIGREETEKGVDTNGPESSGQHIMISYQWGVQKLMIRLKDKLESLGYRVWIDIESMGGSTLQAMADAVEKSAVVLLCMSRKYKDSPNCRTEAEYAYKLGKTLVPIRVERSYEPDGWLGALQGAKLYFDFSNLVEFDTVFSKLTKEIGDKAKMAVDVMDGPPPPLPPKPPQLAIHARPLIKNWTSKEVKDWASANNVHAKNLSSFDGETLLFLKDMNNTAPEFYFKFIYDGLGVTELRSVLNLHKALEALTD